MYCTEDCKCSLCRELRGFDYRRELNRSKKFNKFQKDGNFKMKKAQSTFELPQFDRKLKDNKYPSTTDLANRNPEDKHKVIIYFSDAYRPNSGSQSNLDVDHAKRLAEEIQIKQGKQESGSSKDFMKQLKTVLEEKSKTKPPPPPAYDRPAPKPPTTEQLEVQRKLQHQKPNVPPKKTTEISNDKPNVENQTKDTTANSNSNAAINQSTFTKTKPLPSYIESIENNVIKLKIEQNFKKASELVDLISSFKTRKKSCVKNGGTEDSSVHELNFSNNVNGEEEIDDDDETASEPEEGFYYDWSFVQEWRSR